MTPEQKRTAIAEKCGWRKCACGDLECGVWFAPGASADDPSLDCPDYLNDLNACHEMEKVLTDEQWTDYANILTDMAQCSRKGMIHATASQRADAFLLTFDLMKD